MPITSSTSVKLDTKTKERVQRLAALRRRSPHWVLREAVEQYVEREEKREQFRQDALAAGTIIKRPASMPPPRKPINGWRNSKRGRTLRALHATIEMVATGAAGCRPPL